MTPHEHTHAPDSVPTSSRPGDPTAPLRRTRVRRRDRTTSLRRIRRVPRFASTVWSCAEAEPLPGTAALTGWLARTILTLVTGYTNPGQRVLLVTPPTTHRARATITATGDIAVIGPTRGDPYGGLHEACWTIARLGRGVDTATGTPPPDYPDEHADRIRSVADRSVSGPRPDRPEPVTATPLAPLPRGDRTETAGQSGPGFDLIITALHPRAVPRHVDTGWASLLAPHGTLAVITHRDSSGGAVVDPVPAVVAAFRSHGLRWYDHIAVVSGSLRPAAGIEPTGLSRTSRPLSGQQREPASAYLPARRAYHDLLVFSPASAATTPARGLTGERKTSDD